jgi:hypothetical protein
VIPAKHAFFQRALPVALAYNIGVSFFVYTVMIKRGTVNFDIFVMLWVILIVFSMCDFVFIFVQLFGSILGFCSFDII